MNHCYYTNVPYEAGLVNTSWGTSPHIADRSLRLVVDETWVEGVGYPKKSVTVPLRRGETISLSGEAFGMRAIATVAGKSYRITEENPFNLSFSVPRDVNIQVSLQPINPMTEGTYPGAPRYEIEPGAYAILRINVGSSFF